MTGPRTSRPMLLAAAALFLLLAAVLFQMSRFEDGETPPAPTPTATPAAASTPLPTPDPLSDEVPEEQPVPEDDGLPHDKLFITVERQAYQDGDLTLIIPKLDKTLTVYAGTTAEALAQGVGLFEYAQLPGEGNRNVSIAGHRNGIRHGKITDSAPFYYVDTLEEGDYLYLTDHQSIFRYLYEDTTIVEADDWGPIYSQGFSCLTLTTCHPIGISDHRMIVRGRLDEIIPYTDDYDYPSHQEEASQP